MILRVLQITVLFFVGLVAFGAWIFVSTPSAARIRQCVVTKHYKVRLCPGDRNYVPLSRISPYLKNLIVISEDASFYSHAGFDWSELQNSLSANFAQQKFVRGGSTITQQLAKNVFLDFEKTLSRKIREALIAQDLEEILSKNEILERYLNVIEFGPRIMGVGAAANHYFDKSPAELNLLESAFLTYLVPNPKVYSRVFQKGELTPFARYRLLDLCYRMFRFHKITLDQYLAAKNLASDFPWKAASPLELSRLDGITVNAPPATTPGDPVAQQLPEEDQVLAPVEPSPEEQEELDETYSESENSPFDP